MLVYIGNIAGKHTLPKKNCRQRNSLLPNVYISKLLPLKEPPPLPPATFEITPSRQVFFNFMPSCQK